MSQFWHSHWTEDSFKPVKLGNWEVPNWHPKWPCARHCVTTKFQADISGRILADQPRSKRSPWGDFKGTWELPLKIDKKLAYELSAPRKYKKAAWEAHKILYQSPCANNTKTNAPNPKTTKKILAGDKKSKVTKTQGVDISKPTLARGQETKKEVPKSNKPLVKSKKETKQELPQSSRPQKLKVREDDTRQPEEDNQEKKVEVNNDDETSDIEEGSVESVNHEEPKESPKTDCRCEHKIDSCSQDAPRRKNVCTIHRRFRV